MSRLVTLIRKELAAYFNSPIAYIFLVVFASLVGFLFMSQFFLASRADMRAFFQVLPVILCVFLPAVTMRLWAEEKQGNTYELLLTLPMPPHQLVLGKFLASLIFYVLALLSTLPIPIMLHMIGKPDLGPIIGGYLGAICLGAFFLAVGMFLSGLCRDQIVAFIVGMVACFVLFLFGTEFIASTIDGWIHGLGGIVLKYVGVTQHVSGFERGVIDGRDVGYFGLGTLLMLILNGFWIEGRMRPKQRQTFVTAILVSAGIFVAGNWLLSDVALARFDLTAGRIYTISPVSKKILRELPAPVTIKYYVSPEDKMPTAMKTLERDVLDKLDEFRLASNGQLDYKVFRMEAARVEQEREGEESLEASARRKGIQPFQVQSIEADELGVRLVYSSMAIAYKEKPDEILPRIIPQNLEQLEYLLLSKIYRMTLPSTPAIALVAPVTETPIDPQLRAALEQAGQKVPEQQVADEYKLIPELLGSEGYTVNRIELKDEASMPKDTKTLMLLEPKSLTETQQRLISKFLVEGGSVFLAAQARRFEYTFSGRGEITVSPKPETPNLSAMLTAWGVGLEERILLDASQDAVNVGSGMRLGPFAFNLPLKLPVHIRVNPDTMNQEVSITSRLAPFFYLWGSALTIDRSTLEARQVQARTLMRSSADSWLIPTERLGELSQTARPAAADPRGPFPLAVLLEGTFADPFASARATPLTPAAGKLLVIGAFTPFQEQLIRAGSHATFLLNAVDALTLGESLIQIRAKQPVDRSMAPMASGVKAWWRFFVCLLVPLLMAGAGWMRMLMRRRAKRQYVQLVEATA
ncbi:MAG: Gldg family protein [Candidatus Omnitrophica bacterium]|nr:Gldg family protein [Candidatus Omnitrophota bacterium]